MNGLRKINLQLFAEGETNPDKAKEVKKETPVNPFDKFYIRNEERKEPENNPDVKTEGKPENEPEEQKTPESSKELETKEPEKKEEEFYTIKHLGKEVKIPASERDKYLQMGLDYTFQKEEAKKAKETLKRIARAEGFDSVEKYLAELERREKARLAEQIEEAVGNPDKIAEIVEKHPLVVETREERRKLEFEKIRNELSKDMFFKELEDEFNRLVEANPKVDPRLTYKILRSDYLTEEKLKEIAAKEREAAEKKVIADLHDKEKRSTPTGGDSGDGKNVVQPSEFTRKIAGIFGVSAQKVAQRVYEKTKRS